MKTLVLIPNKKYYCFNKSIKSKYEIYNYLFNFINLHYNFFKKIFKLRISLFYSFWKYKKYEKIILFDYIIYRDPNIIKYIKDKKITKKIIIYKWNNGFDLNFLKENKEIDIDIYDYDENECNKYGYKHNTIMYNEEFAKKYNKKKREIIDVFYLGFKKNRFDMISKATKILSKYGINYKIYIVGEKEADFKDENVFFLKEPMSYKKYIKYINASKCILDIPQKFQIGKSLRLMETIFFDKKLVTISNEFINSINLFELDSKEEFDKFINMENENCDELKKYYSFEQWLERFQ